MRCMGVVALALLGASLTGSSPAFAQVIPEGKCAVIVASRPSLFEAQQWVSQNPSSPAKAIIKYRNGQSAAYVRFNTVAANRCPCCAQSSGNPSKRSSSCNPAGCRPLRIASTMSGASSVNRSAPADIGRVHALCPSEVLHRRVHFRRPTFPPPKCARQRLHHRVADPRPRRPLRPVRRHHQLPPTTLPERQRDVDRDGLPVGRYRCLFHAAALLLPATSRASPPSPFGRSRPPRRASAHRPARPADARSAPARQGTAPPTAVELRRM